MGDGAVNSIADGRWLDLARLSRFYSDVSCTVAIIGHIFVSSQKSLEMVGKYHGCCGTLIQGSCIIDQVHGTELQILGTYLSQ